MRRVTTPQKSNDSDKLTESAEASKIVKRSSKNEKHPNTDFSILQETSGSEKLKKTIETKKSRIIRLPKIGCITSNLMSIFNDLSNTGAVLLDTSEIMRAVNIVLKVQKDMDEGIPWNEKIEIVKNLYLKLYKSGLVLHLKNKK